MLQLLLDIDHVTVGYYVRRCRSLLTTECHGLLVCLSVCHLMSSAKTAEAIEMSFALRTRVGPRNHLFDIAELFQPNTVLWAFHTIQPSSYICVQCGACVCR